MERVERTPRPIAESPGLARMRRAMELLVSHEGRFRRTARRVSLCAEDAEDAFQRGVEILLTKGPAADRDDLAAWTQVVIRREALAVRRERERLLRQRADGRGESPIERLAAGGRGPLEQATERERIARLAARLRHLKPAERRAIGLQAAGCSYAEIQAITGWSYTKVNRCLAEGRARLRRVDGAGQPLSAA